MEEKEIKQEVQETSKAPEKLKENLVIIKIEIIDVDHVLDNKSYMKKK